jgi:hypothetical protein
MLALCSGCGGPALLEVKGTVTYDGRPLTHGVVSFVPLTARGNGGRVAVGSIGADGRFRLGPAGEPGGVAPGSYRVLVSCWEDPVVESGTPAGTTPRGVSVVPERYGDFSTSDLKARVSRFGSNRFAFDLSSHP